LVSFLVVAGFFMLREYWNHVLGFASYLLLLALPLMHLFHCRGCHRHCETENKGGGCCR
jgi:hypothetical protein